MRTPRYRLILVLLLGLALLWRTIEWYDGYLRRMSYGPRTPASAAGGSGQPAVPPTRRPRPTPTPSPEPALPELEALRSPEVFKRREAALALGALAKDPELVERALLDPYHGVSQTARRVILKSPGDAGARMLARALVRDPGNAEAAFMFRQRDLLERDVTPALLEIALDGTAPERHRRSALDLLGRYGNPLAADALLGVAHGPDEALRPAGEIAITELERRAKGKMLPMKELGPRPTGRPAP